VAARRGIDLFVKRVIGFKGSSSTPGGHGGPPLQYVPRYPSFRKATIVPRPVCITISPFGHKVLPAR